MAPSDTDPIIKSILITQPQPETGKNIYEEFAKKYKLKIDFRPFIHIEPMAPRDIRRQKINFNEYSAIIFNSRNAVDYFFALVSEMKLEMSIETKYFSINEGVSNYVQKYIVPRKRKMFFGKSTEADFLTLFNKKHNTEKFLFPCSDIRKATIPNHFANLGYSFTECVIYNTVSSDLSDLSDVFYDVLVFFSPADIKSLFDNFPHFVQNNTRIAGFGSSTHIAIAEHNLVLDIVAPALGITSMLGALEVCLSKVNGK
ncbi:MAG: uroporphyrinogen-III synthase [Flavobacteriales bacterium]|nr:MAG: uroporphyrinogen-III synthase [Flavobacteriales bacterium]